jgi:hypothetical protein
MLGSLDAMIGRKVVNVRPMGLAELHYENAASGVLIELTRGQAIVICTLKTGEQAVRWQHDTGAVSILDQAAETYSG